MTDDMPSSALPYQRDVLALAAGITHDETDNLLLDDPAFTQLMDDIENHSRPLPLALAAAGLVFDLIAQLARERHQLPEDVLAEFALTIAHRMPPTHR
jgi:hypothetical protein